MTKHTKLSIHARLEPIFEKAIKHWKADKIITAPQAKQCQASLAPMLFNWHRFANVVFWFACVALLSAFFHALSLFSLSKNAIFVVTGVIAFFSFVGGHYLDQENRQHPYASGSLYLLGIIMLNVAAACLITNPMDLILVTSILICILGVLLRSGLIWGLGIIKLCTWATLWGTEFNTVEKLSQGLSVSPQLPAKISLLFGVIAIFISIGIKSIPAISRIYKGSLIASYLIVFLNLLSLSLPMYTANGALILGPLLWSLALAAVSLLAIVCGVKNQYPITLRFGVIFFMLNFITLCTGYLQLVLNDMIYTNLVIAICLGIIGKAALTIKELEEKKHHDK